MSVVLPPVEPTGHRRDVRVAELPESLGRERAVPPGSRRDLAVLVGHQAFDLRLEQASREMEGTRQRTLGILVRLADIEEERLVEDRVPGPGSISTMSCLAWFSMSLKLGTSPTLPRCSGVLKRYQRDQLSQAGGPCTTALVEGSSSRPVTSVSVRRVELDEVVRRRRMTRHYGDNPVPAEVLDRVLGVALRGPSAGFSQGVDLLVLEGPAQARLFFEMTSDPEFLAGPRSAPRPPPGTAGHPAGVRPERLCRSLRGGGQGPVEPRRPRSRGLAGAPYWLVDSSFTVMLLLLAATDEGLGALFFRLHRDPERLLEALGVPETKLLIGAVASATRRPPARRGPQAWAGSSQRPARRAMDDAVHRGRW